MRKNRRSLYSTNFISSIVSIGLVLFLLGLIGVIIIHSNEIARHVRENINITIMLKEDVREADRIKLQKILDAKPQVASTRYVSPEEAAQQFQKDIGEDFVEFLGYIPIPPSIELHVKAEYANVEFLEKFINELKKESIVKNVYYEKDLVNVINQNIARISIILALVALLLFLISVVLINNTMRLHIYAKRFLIKSMLLVGASNSFIRKPFLVRGFWIGFLGAIFAVLLLIGILQIIQRNIPDIEKLFVIDYFAMLIFIIFVIGIILSVSSSFFAVKKYIRLDLDLLYK